MAALVERVKAIGVLCQVDCVNNFLTIELSREGRLYQDDVYTVIPI